MFMTKVTRNVFDDVFGSDPFFSNNWVSSLETESTFPKYNLISNGDGSQTIEVAVAGYTKDQLEVFVESGHLHIVGTKKTSEEDTKRKYVRKNIAERSFDLKFVIKGEIEVAAVSLENGILSVEVNTKSPEKPKRKTFAIK